MKKQLVAIAYVLTLLASMSVVAETRIVNKNISEAEVLAAQKAWGDALVAISDAYEKNGQGAAKDLAVKVIDAAYGYQFGPVLFKPTLTQSPQTFRTPVTARWLISSAAIPISQRILVLP